MHTDRQGLENSADSQAYALQAKNMLRVPRTSVDGLRTILEGMEKLPGAPALRHARRVAILSPAPERLKCVTGE
ncbi:MAG TPA: hypothetical protein VIE90_06175 [Candidatus Binatia bacterium]